MTFFPLIINPPKTDLLKARREKATVLLSNEVLLVQQVADLCGFANVRHFTRQFKKLYGCTPEEYSRKAY
nr:AraC family transcriptional regulator [Clostridium sp. KNHs205]